MKDKKNVIINAIFFIMLFIITYWIIFRKQNINELFYELSNLNVFYIILGIFVMFQYYVIESLNIKLILSSFHEKISFFKSLKFSMICAFYSAITPASTGGQPMQIYYMSKEKISVSHSTIALLTHLCGYQISAIILGIIGACFNLNIFNSRLTILFICGTLFNAIALSITLIGIFNNKLSLKLVHLFLKILKFFKYKKVSSLENKLKDELKLYHENANYIKKHKSSFIYAIIIAFIQMIVYHSVPYFTYKAFGLSGYNMFNFITLQAILHCTVASIPLPGSIGINETTFLLIYGPIFGENILPKAMLVHRGISFYLFVLINLVVVIYNSIKITRTKKHMWFK